jgi:outer membrane protein assembly factor BamD
MLKQARILALCGLIFGLVPACAEQKAAESPLHYTENAKRAYEQALVAFFDRDWEYATQQMQEVKRKYGYSRYARLAELRLADINYHQEKYAEAVGMYKSFVADYGNDAEVPYAKYKIAKAEFVQSGASILLPPLEERDLSNVRDAHVALRALIADYPDSKHTAELSYMLEVVTGLLARHELYVAHFYLNRDNFDAAVARCKYALANYQDSGLEPEALVLLGETYLKMKEDEKARTTFELVLGKYPESAFVVPAKNFLAKMGSSGVSAHAFHTQGG